MMIAVTVHRPAFWVTERGYEFTLLTLVAALGLALAGPGAYALDAALEIALPQSMTLTVALCMAVGGALVATITRGPVLPSGVARTDE